jgi:cytochrome c oxidase cbb3-type subunit 3
LQTDKAKLAEGETVFKTKCATCHGPDGGGLAGSGANLTDEYWIHGNSVKEVFKTIRYGVLSAGMVAWDGQIPPDKMRSVASYVLSLQGTKPANPQPPKGDKMEPKEKF